MLILVLDASAAVEIALWTVAGACLAEHAASADELVVPDHFFLECAAALRRLQFHRELTPVEADAALEQILSLRVRRVDTAPMLRDAWSLRHNVTIADALYVVLARKLGVPMLTGDLRLSRAPGTGVEILTDASAPSAQPAGAAPPAAEAEDRQERDARFVSDTYIGGGWMRTLPPAAVVILSALVGEGTLAREELEKRLASSTANGLGLRAAAWDPLHEYTDEELAELDAQFEGTPFETRENEPRTAVEVMADEAARRQEQLDEMDHYSATLGVAPVRTIGDLVEFMTACRLLAVDESGRYALNHAAPLPVEVLPLPVEEAAIQNRLRWADLHEPVAQALIRLFKPDSDQPVDQMQTSLQRLAELLDADPESVRSSLANLLEEGDFAASLDVTTIRENHVFVLAVDWPKFYRQRVHVRTVSGDPPDASESGST